MSDAEQFAKQAGETLSPSQFELAVTVLDGGFNATAQRNRDIIVDAYRAMLNGNPAALADVMHPDVVFREADGLPYGCNVRGLDAALKGVAGMFDAWSSVRVELTEVLASSDLVIAYMNLATVSRATGRRYSGPVCEVFRFEGDRIVEWYPVYWDTHKVREVCGLLDPARGETELS